MPIGRGPALYARFSHASVRGIGSAKGTTQDQDVLFRKTLRRERQHASKGELHSRAGAMKTARNITEHSSSINGLRVIMHEHPNAPRGRTNVSYLEATPGDVGQRIDNYLARHLKGAPRSLIYRILRTGQVRVNGRRARPEYRLIEGDRIRLPPLERAQRVSPRQPSKSLQELIARSCLYEDRDLIVVNKPAGVAVHGGSGISFGVIEALRALHPQLKELDLVHRLDRETSGCLLVAKRRSLLRELHALLRERQMDKTYLALLVGRWPFGTKKIDLPLKTNLKQGGERVVRVHAEGQDAVSTFTPLEHFKTLATLVSVSIGTGRTHQIRVHAAHAGYPIAGDDKYGDRDKDEELKPHGLDRMFLHAHSVTFPRARSHEPFSITAPLPAELQAVLDRLAQVSARRTQARPGR